MNKKALEFFRQMANKEVYQNSCKLAANTDFTDIDSKFILKYADSQSCILDLGSGTGLIVNKIYPFVKQIVCVDKYEQFTKFITKNPSIIIYNQDLFEFNTKIRFDIITAFGIMHYVDEEEATKLYKKYAQFLKQGGKLIIKNQFGLKETINISGYSQEQKTDYYSQYRYIKREQEILSSVGYEIIEVNDIYPPEANRWDNTHFFAIVALKKG